MGIPIVDFLLGVFSALAALAFVLVGVLFHGNNQTEIKRGKYFRYGLKMLKCEEAFKGGYRCAGCAFDGGVCQFHKKYLGSCNAKYRKDKTNVIFIEEE